MNDKERITIFAKVITAPRKVLARKTTIINFDVLTSNNTYFKVVAFNRPYLSKLVDLNEEYTINGIYDKNREFFKTNSPSMDILISSNLERLLYFKSKDEAKVKNIWIV